MKERMEALLCMLQECRFEEGESLTLSAIERAEKQFMEELTLETATDLVGMVLLFAEFSSKEKKPWKATQQLDRVEGALRFMADFMSDRETAAATFYQVASLYAYAGFYPEASKFYYKSLETCESFADAENAVYYFLVNLFRMDQKVSADQRDRFEKILGTERYRAVLEEAKGDFAKEILRDPLEREERFLSVRFALEKAVDEAMRLSSEDPNTPYCIRYWDLKKKILAERFDLAWKSPEDMNPDIQFV